MLDTFDTQLALTASGSSPSPGWDLGDPSFLATRTGPLNVAVLLNVTSATGVSPSLTVEVKWSNDGVNYASAATPDTLPAITAATAVTKSFQVKGRFARLFYTVSGTTPSFAFTATGYAD